LHSASVSKKSPSITERRSRGRPRLEEVADLEKQLMDIALKEFLANGYGGTSMAMIVKKAGVSKTTLYSRFGSKADLFLGIMGKLFAVDRTRNFLVDDESPMGLEEGLKFYARQLIVIGLNDLVRGIDRLLYSEAYHFPDLAATAGKLNREVVATLTEFIRKCAEREGRPCRDPAKPARLIAQVIRGYHANILLQGKDVSEKEIQSWADSSIDTILAGREVW